MQAPPSSPARGDRVVVVLAFLVALAAYWRTAAPGVVVEGDSCEYVAAARVAGIPHAPGYPTYMLVASALGAVVPAEHLARALNLVSVLCGALTVGLVVLVTLRLVRRARPRASPEVARGAAAVAGLALTSATEFWNQSLGAEVYTMGMALLALCLERWSADGGARRWTPAALAAGLAFGVHYNVAIPCALLVGWGAWSARGELGGRGLARLAGVFALGLATFLYLPLRSLADPALDFGDPETPAAIWRMLTLQDQSTGRDLARGLGELLGQLRAVGGLAARQWPAWVFLLVAAGLPTAWRRARESALVLAGLVALNVVGVLAMSNFELEDQWVYELRFLFLPAYAACALLAGLALGWLGEEVEARLGRVALAAPVLAVVGLAPWFLTRLDVLDKSDDRVMEEYGRALLDAAEGPAVLFTFGDNAWMALTNAQVVHGLRPDVTVVAGTILGYPWYRRQLVARHPELALDDSAPGVPGTARANLERVALYHSDPRRRGLPGFQEVPSGLLMRIVPAGRSVPPRVPPAFSFTAPWAPLDMRERSIRADVAQAYARTAAWCAGAGFPADAERAYREGLSIAVPVPPMEEFHLVRAGLWLGLGDLQAVAGRLGDARASWESARDEAPESAPGRQAAERLAATGGSQ